MESFGSPLLEELSLLVNRWSSHHFQLAHASRLHNERDFTANQVLFRLGSTGPMRPSELALELGSGRANVSKVLARLESDSLISRSPDPHDSRASVVALTERGREVSADVFRIGEEMITELTADWSAEDRRVFAARLRQLNVAAAAYESRLRAGGAGRASPRDDGPAERKP
jgi:DNA-binding MarR family transcriptional regulator